MSDPLFDLADEHGWTVVVYPDTHATHGSGFRCLITRKAEITEYDVLADVCGLLLSRLRDEHPDPDVADKAADLLLALHMKSRTV